MQITIPFSVLKQWVNNFKDNPGVPFGTTSAKIGLSTAPESTKHQFDKFYKENFVNIAEQGFRIFFIRVTQEDNEKWLKYRNWEYTAENLSQVSIVIVPVKWEGKKDKIIIDNDNNVTIFIPGGENTGLCPNDCEQLLIS